MAFKITAEEKRWLEDRRTANLLQLAVLASIRDERRFRAVASLEADAGIKDLLPGFKALLSSLGLHVSSGDGLIQILFRSGRNVALLIYYAVRASVSQDPVYKEKLSKLANKKISKAEVMDFLLKLDQVTLHAFTGPIHMIDAVTGWHIGADLKDAVTDTGRLASQTLKKLKRLGEKLNPASKPSFIKYFTKLQKLFSV